MLATLAALALGQAAHAATPPLVRYVPPTVAV
jgi:hypothetical protein